MVSWAYKGLHGSNRTAFILQDYANKKTLAALGYQFDENELECWQVEAYNLIASTIADLEKKERDRSTPKRKR